jgi:hypothetical protein
MTCHQHAERVAICLADGVDDATATKIADEQCRAHRASCECERPKPEQLDLLGG